MSCTHTLPCVLVVSFFGVCAFACLWKDIEEPEEGAPGTAGWSQVDPRQKKKDKIEVKLEVSNCV